MSLLPPDPGIPGAALDGTGMEREMSSPGGFFFEMEDLVEEDEREEMDFEAVF